jgi:hypothetical protein
MTRRSATAGKTPAVSMGRATPFIRSSRGAGKTPKPTATRVAATIGQEIAGEAAATGRPAPAGAGTSP